MVSFVVKLRWINLTYSVHTRQHKRECSFRDQYYKSTGGWLAQEVEWLVTKKIGKLEFYPVCSFWHCLKVCLQVNWCVYSESLKPTKGIFSSICNNSHTHLQPCWSQTQIPLNNKRSSWTASHCALYFIIRPNSGFFFFFFFHLKQTSTKIPPLQTIPAMYVFTFSSFFLFPS